MVHLNEVGLGHEHPEPTYLWAPFENIVRAESENDDEIMVDVCWYMVKLQGKQRGRARELWSHAFIYPSDGDSISALINCYLAMQRVSAAVALA